VKVFEKCPTYFYQISLRILTFIDSATTIIWSTTWISTWVVFICTKALLSCLGVSYHDFSVDMYSIIAMFPGNENHMNNIWTINFMKYFSKRVPSQFLLRSATQALFWNFYLFRDIKADVKCPCTGKYIKSKCAVKVGWQVLR
jgi:hypothetical protein